MYLVKAVLAGALAVIPMTVIYVLIEMRNAVAAARAAGFRGEIGVDLSFLVRDGTYLSLAVISFAVGFFFVLRSHWPK